MSSGLHNSGSEEIDAGIEVHEGDEDGTGRFAEDRNLIRVPTESLDIVLYPLQTGNRVLQTEVRRVVRCDLRAVSETKDTESVIDGHDDYRLLRLKSLSHDQSGIIDTSCAFTETSPVSSEAFINFSPGFNLVRDIHPYHDWERDRRVRTLGSVDVKVETVFRLTVIP